MDTRIHIRPLTPADAAAFQALRLAGLAEAPEAFSSSVEEERDLPLAVIAGRLAATADRAMLGAFDGADLAGVVGIVREDKLKLRHKAFIWGMYVAPAFRGRHVARQLLDRALAVAAAMPGLRQVTLGVNARNAGAVRLYESLGFVRYGLEPDALHIALAFHDRLDMVYRLTA